MERLTRYRDNGYPKLKACDLYRTSDCKEDCVHCEDLTKAIRKLAEYEDKIETGQLQEVKNEPLTIEELKALEFGEWVWIEILEEEQFHDFLDTGYYTKSAMFDNNERFVGWRGCYGTCFLYKYYGICWIAYKNKEQAEAKLRELKENK